MPQTRENMLGNTLSLKYDDSYADRLLLYFVEKAEGSYEIECRGTLLAPDLPTFEGACLSLGISRATLYNWKEEHERFRHAYTQCELIQEDMLVKWSLKGLYNPKISTLLLTNKYNYEEKKKIDTDNAISCTINVVK